MARRLKVGFLCQPYDLVLPPVQNSIGLWTFEVARRLSPTCDVTVYGPSQKGGPRQATHDGARFRLLPPGGPFGPVRSSGTGGRQDIRQPDFVQADYYRDYITRIVGDMRGQDFDIGHVSHFIQFTSLIKKSDPRAKTVLHMQCDWLSGLDPVMIRRRLRDVDLILGCSDYITESIRVPTPKSGSAARRFITGPTLTVSSDGTRSGRQTAAMRDGSLSSAGCPPRKASTSCWRRSTGSSTAFREPRRRSWGRSSTCPPTFFGRCSPIPS